MGIQTPITIAQVIQCIQSNDYILPSIQREFVWSPEQIEKLFDSLMRGYPIGSFLYWQIKRENLQDFQFYRFMNHYHERDYRHNEPIELVGEGIRNAILDGQQRFTALYIGLKGWYAEKLPYYRWNNNLAYPRKRLYLNLLSEPDLNRGMAFEFRMLKEADASERDEQHHWFLIGEILNFKDMPDVFNHCISIGLVNQNLKYPANMLLRLWKVINEEPVISYFLEEEHNLDKVLNIFIRVNSGGTPLSYSDMLLSIATAQWKNMDAREEIYGLVDDLNINCGETFNFNKDFVLKSCLILSDIKSIEFKVDNFNRDNMINIENQWRKIADSLKTTTRLISKWGYTRDTLVSNNAVIPLAYYIHKNEMSYDKIDSPNMKQDQEKMHRWLMRALIRQTFSGTPDNVLRQVRQVINTEKVGFPEDAIYVALSRSSKSMSFDEPQIEALLDYHYGQPMTFTLLAALYPWLKYDQHFHIDHIFPRSMFTQKRLRYLNIPEERWGEWIDHRDDLANLQLLQGKINQNKSDKEFEAWLLEAQPEPQGLTIFKEQQLIPEVELKFEKFPEFIEARNKIIKQKLSELLRK